MNLESLYHKIERPGSLGAADIPALKELCAKYPYAQLFSVLYLKALALNKDLHFEDELQQHAYKITDRAKLFDLIQGREAENPAIEEMIENEPEHIADREEENPIIGKDLPKENVQPQHVAAPFEETIPEEISPENLPAESLPTETAAADEAKPDLREIDELEKEILSGVMATAYSLELEEKLRAEHKNEDIEAVKPQHVPAQRDENPKTDLNQSRSFTSWLKLASEEKSPEQKEKTGREEMIEKFIQKEPERIKPKTEFYSAPKKARESISEEKLVYTETLANIYALQGNYPKAITAFQQLMLTIPEKKLYFAQKIEELNKKINS